MTAGRGSAQKRHARDSCFFSRFSACNCRPKMVCYEQIVKGDIAPLSEHNRFIIASQAPACQGVFVFSGDRPRFFCVLGGENPESRPARGKKAAHRKSFRCAGEICRKTLRVFPTKGLQSAARIICVPMAHKFHTGSLRCIFSHAHVARENDFISLPPAGGKLCEAFFDTLGRSGKNRSYL